jgi:hypothetical protein
MSRRLWLGIALGLVALGVVLGSLFAIGVFAGNGRLAVAVHDAPCAACTHVWVTFSSVQVHESDTSGSGWTTLNVSGATVDLAALNGSQAAKVIGVDTLRAGHYEQIRIAVTHVAVTLATGANVTAHLTSAASADVNGAFDVKSGQTTEISVDIDLATSVHVTVQGGATVVTFTPNVGSVQVVSTA